MTSILRLSAVALLLTACSKKSSPPPVVVPQGTVSFVIGTDTTKMTDPFCDTSNAELYVQYTGIFPGATDTAVLYFYLTPKTAGNDWLSHVGGVWSDISATQSLAISLRHRNSNITYMDAFVPGDQSKVHPATLTITANNGSVLSANFSGELFDVNGGSDSLYISTGSFTVKLP